MFESSIKATAVDHCFSAFCKALDSTLSVLDLAGVEVSEGSNEPETGDLLAMIKTVGLSWFALAVEVLGKGEGGLSIKASRNQRRFSFSGRELTGV